MVSAERSFRLQERRVPPRSVRYIRTYKPLESLAVASGVGLPTCVHSCRALPRPSEEDGTCRYVPGLASKLQFRFRPQSRHIHKVQEDGGSTCEEISRLPPVAEFRFRAARLATLRVASADQQQFQPSEDRS